MRNKRDPDEIASGSLTKLAAPDGSPSAASSAASPGYYYTLGSPPFARVSPPLTTNQLRKTASTNPSRHVHAIHESYSNRLDNQVKNGRQEILASWRTLPLVPKLRLGTHAAKLRFASSRRADAKQSFATSRSQAELGNEGQSGEPLPVICSGRLGAERAQ